MSQCPDIQRELGAYAGGELENPVSEMVAAHLKACASCREELEREMFLRRALGGLDPVTAPPELESRIRSAIGDGRRDRTHPWKPGRLTAAALLAAASLAIAILVPGLLTSPQQEWSDQEIASARQDLMYTLALTAKIIDLTQKDTVVDVFGDKLPHAINDSFKMTKPNNSGGNG